MDEEHAWSAANNIYTLITQDAGTGMWRESVMEVLRAAWILGYDEGQASDA